MPPLPGQHVAVKRSPLATQALQNLQAVPELRIDTYVQADDIAALEWLSLTANT